MYNLISFTLFPLFAMYTFVFSISKLTLVFVLPSSADVTFQCHQSNMKQSYSDADFGNNLETG